MRSCALLVLAAAAAVTMATAAPAGQAARETIHDEGELVLEDFCGVEGMTVDAAYVVDLRVHVVRHGRDRQAYFLQHGTRTETLTNRATGKTVTSVAKVIEKDLRVTDNGDGTLTVLVLATGNAVLYGADGKAIARDPGQVRFELLVDQAGTPADPSDDEVVVFLGVVKESTGRSDDFCEAAVSALS